MSLEHKQNVYKANYLPKKILVGIHSLERLNTFVLCGCGCGEFTRKYNEDGVLRRFVDAGHSNRGRKHNFESWNKGKTKFNNDGLMSISKKMVGNKNSLGKKRRPEAIEKTRNYLKILGGMNGLERNYQKKCECGCGQLIQGFARFGKQVNYLIGHTSEEGRINKIKARNSWKGTQKEIDMGKKVSKAKKGVPMPKWQYFEMLEKKRQENELQTELNKDRIESIAKDEIIVGLLLSDADISRPKSANSNSRFHLSQKASRREFIVETQRYLKKLGFDSTITESVTREHPQLDLNTRTHVIWTELRKRWYVDGFKTIPKNIELAPKTLAWWFMGDGSSTPDKAHKNLIQATLSTQGFSKSDTMFLAKQLEKLGFTISLSNVRNLMDKGKHNTGLRIFITKQSSVREFMLMIKPFILPVFEYKVKIPIVRNEKVAFAEYMRAVKNNPKTDNQKIIQLYLDYQNTDLTRIQIYDEIQKKTGFERSKMAAACRYYFNKIPKEKARPQIKDKIIDLYLHYKDAGISNSEIYDLIQEKLKIPTSKRKSLIRNRISLFTRR